MRVRRTSHVVFRQNTRNGGDIINKEKTTTTQKHAGQNNAYHEQLSLYIDFVSSLTGALAPLMIYKVKRCSFIVDWVSLG